MLLAHDPAVQQLEQKGYSLTLLPAHLVVNHIPYVTAEGNIEEGKFIIPVQFSGETVTLADHQIEFMGQVPCTANGVKMSNILADYSGSGEIEVDIVSNYRFSSKPSDSRDILDDCLKKVKHYEAIICSQAQAINPDATACVFKPMNRIEEMVFRYADTNAGRAGITEHMNRLRQHRIAIVGLGGTGSYVLDLVAKTPVAEIHLFDGDVFDSHNAFRAPGAASVDELKAQMHKVTYHAAKYDSLRTGIYEHAYNVTEDRLLDLDRLDFVFVCIDDGPARKLITSYLRERNIAFIDTGIDITNRASNNMLEATSRVLYVGSDASDQVMGFLSFGDIDDDLYTTNIQIADINMLNACQAVIEWKKGIGFYADDKPEAYQMVYDSQDNRLIYAG